jgi:predicted patatin/cPLA2 family phospholipase
MNTRDKTAIICLGGGMRSAHGAGFLYALATVLDITDPDIIIGTSGNSGNVLYYVSKQYDSAVHVWCGGMLSTWKFITFLRPWKILNVDYLVDTIFKQREPLNTEALHTTHIDWYVPATDTQTGKPRYFGKADKLDAYELLRAAAAIPIFYRRRIVVFGKTYFDGELGPTVADHVHQAIERGATKILVINDTSPKGALSSLEMHVYAAMQSPHLREAIVRDIDEVSACITSDKATVLCVSTSTLPVGILTRSRKKLIAAFDAGMQNALAMEQELRTLFHTPV